MTHKSPHVVVMDTGDWHTPTLFMPNAQGAMQAADMRPSEEDPLAAKRVAVAWAHEMGVPYHGTRVVRPGDRVQLTGRP